MKYCIFFAVAFLALASHARAEVEAEWFKNVDFYVTVSKTTNTSTVVVSLSDITGAPQPPPPHNATAQWFSKTQSPNITAITNAVVEGLGKKYTVSFDATSITITVNTPSWRKNSFDKWTFKFVVLSVTGTLPDGTSTTGKVKVTISRPKPTKPGKPARSPKPGHTWPDHSPKPGHTKPDHSPKPGHTKPDHSPKP